MSSANGLALGGSYRARFDLFVEIGTERGGGFRTEGLALLFRAEPLLRPLARTGHRLLRPVDRPLHLHGESGFAEIRRDAPLLRFGKDGKRIGGAWCLVIRAWCLVISAW